MAENSMVISQQAQKKPAWRAWLMLGLALLYDFSALDLVPDIPVIGWIDDFLFTATAVMGVVQSESESVTPWLSRVAKVLKWCLLTVAVVVVLLIVLLGALAYKLLA